MFRRTFVAALLGSLVSDPEPRLWERRKLISIPRERVLYTRHYEFFEPLFSFEPGEALHITMPSRNNVLTIARRRGNESQGHDAALITLDRRVIGFEGDCREHLAFQSTLQLPAWTVACRVGRSIKNPPLEHLVRYDPEFATFPEVSGRLVT